MCSSVCRPRAVSGTVPGVWAVFPHFPHPVYITGRHRSLSSVSSSGLCVRPNLSKCMWDVAVE
jgi:hypothetical protein